MNALRYRILLFILALAPLGAWGEDLPAMIEEGDLVIRTASDLQTFAANVNGGKTYSGENVYLLNDISLTSEWTPIGTSTNPFKGTFEGLGHKISGLNVSGSDYQGLFGYVQGGSIRDVAVSGSVSGGNYVGGICGYLNGGEISSCYCEANVSGATYTGGICGYSTDFIKDCNVIGSVTSTTSTGQVNIGGIAGFTSGTMICCYMAGTMSVRDSRQYYGAIVGHNQGGTVQNCIYDNTKITTHHAIGGIPNDESTGADDSKDDTTNKGLSTESMKLEITWTDILNLEKSNMAWKIEEGSYPQLYSFLKNEPLTFDFSQSAWLTVVPNGNYSYDETKMEAYRVLSIESDGTVFLRFVKTLNEGRGALLHYKNDESNTDPNKFIVTATKTEGTLDRYIGDRWLKGSHVSPVKIGGTDTHDYTLTKAPTYDEFYDFKRAKSGQLARGKAYLHLEPEDIPDPLKTNDGSRLLVRFENDPTVVHEIEIDAANETVYDLSGRKLSNAQGQGLIIRNGKKMLKR